MRTQQLDIRFTRAEPGDLDILIGDELAKRFGKAERLNVKPHRLVEIGNEDPDVIDFQWPAISR